MRGARPPTWIPLSPLPTPIRERTRVRIAVLVADVSAHARLRLALRALAEELECNCVEDLVNVLARERVDAIIVAPWDSAGCRVAPLLRSIRAQLPSMPVAIYCELTPDAVREVMALTKCGADDVIIRGADDHSPAVWSRLLASTYRRAANEAAIALAPLLPREVAPIFSYCLDRADEGVSVEELASVFHVHRKTLVNRMATAGLPPPSTLISWCRLLLAARLLEDPGRAVEHVALLLGFSSAAALRNMLRRYTGLRPSELRTRGGLQCVAALFKASIAHTGLQSAHGILLHRLADSPYGRTRTLPAGSEASR